MKLIAPIRGSGAPRMLELRGWVLLLALEWAADWTDGRLPDPAVIDPRPDGALHLLWRSGHVKLGVWVRSGAKDSTWEVKQGGRRQAQGRIRFVDKEPHPADVTRISRAFALSL
jgi:hypothetical protein